MDFRSATMNLNERDDVLYLSFKELDKYKFINHAFSTKYGGVSKNEFKSMNLGFGRGDKRENVIENYHRFCNAAGFKYENLVASSQDHKTFIRCVGENEKGIGIYREKDIASVDGLVTNVEGVTLVTYYADCTPVFFLDPVRKVVGLVHAGWRGTVNEIAGKMIKIMADKYQCSVNDIICAIGPSIGKCCYEVDKPVYDKFCDIAEIDKDKIAQSSYGDKYYVDLWETNRQILLKNKVRDENIFVSDICTKCNSDLLFSHRATNGKRGTLAAMICINEVC